MVGQAAPAVAGQVGAGGAARGKAGDLMLRPSAAVSRAPGTSVRQATRRWAADCALIAVPLSAQVADEQPLGATPAIVIAMPLTVRWRFPAVTVPLPASYPAATAVAFAVAVRPATSPELIAARRSPSRRRRHRAERRSPSRRRRRRRALPRAAL